MGAITMRVQTSLHQNTSLINVLLYTIASGKYESSIHNIAFSSEKVPLSESGEKYSQIKHCLQDKTVLNKYISSF